MSNDNLWIYPVTTDPHRLAVEGLEAVFAHLSDASAALTHALEGLEDWSPESLTAVHEAWVHLDDMMKQAHETIRTETTRQMQEIEERHAASQWLTMKFMLLFIPTVCPSVASRNLLLYQSLPISIPYRYALLRRRKDDTGVDTAARGIVA